MGGPGGRVKASKSLITSITIKSLKNSITVK